MSQPTVPCGWHDWPEAGPCERGDWVSTHWTSPEFHLLLFHGAPELLGPNLQFTHFRFISDPVVLGAHRPLCPWHNLSLRPANSLQPGAGHGASCPLGGPSVPLSGPQLHGAPSGSGTLSPCQPPSGCPPNMCIVIQEGCENGPTLWGSPWYRVCLEHTNIGARGIKSSRVEIRLWVAVCCHFSDLASLCLGFCL